jgi:hypothetical protein
MDAGPPDAAAGKGIRMARTVKLAATLALVGLAAVLLLAFAGGGEAQLDPGNKAFFGFVGIAPGETLRLAAVNAGTTAPPDPEAVCRVRLGFDDLDGRPLQDPVEVRLLPGAGGVVDLPYARLSRTGRVEVHPLADVPRGQEGGPFCAVDVVAEVIDDSSGRTDTYVLPVVPEK